MSKENLTFIFDGSGVEKGEIDVQDLAPALLALGDLIQSANEVINGERAKTSVCVKATAEGSFEIDLAITQSILDATLSVFDFASAHKDGIADAKQLADLIFDAVFAPIGFVGGGLFALIKWLKGKKPEKVEHKSDGTTIIFCGDVTFQTNRKAIQLAENIEVRKHARKALSSLSKNGIDKISVRRSGKETLDVIKEELPFFDIPDSEEKLEEETRKMNLQIISLTFKEDNKWKVTDGLEPFSATIEDEQFLMKINNNEIAFSKNDYLVCDVKERQYQTNKGLRKERSIIKVIEHKPSPKQLKLF